MHSGLTPTAVLRPSEFLWTSGVARVARSLQSPALGLIIMSMFVSLSE